MKNVLLIAAMVACSAQAAKLDPDRPIEQQITVQSSEFDAKTRYFSPELRAKMIDADDRVITYLSISKDRKTGALEWGVILGASYDGRWRMYESANLAGGKLLTAQNLGRQVGICYQGSCTLHEGAGVVLGEADIQAALANGLRLRSNSRGYGSFEVEFPAAYFAAMAEAAKR